MLIKEIGIRGFKSFGNNEQVVNLNTEKGELILLMGGNGQGKSSFISSFEWVLYGKAKGSKKKWATLSTLPNRINNELSIRIKFNSNGNDIEVSRGINPNYLTLTENGMVNDRAGKANLDEKIQNYVGMDIETFKSFISLSINDFKNFISLTSEEKQLLLDKLFNLEVINILNEILKQLVKNNKLQLTKHESEINTLAESIASFQRSIEKAKEKQKQDLQSEIDQIKTLMESKKDEFISLKEKVEKIRAKDSELKADVEKEREQLIRITSEIRTAQKDIDLYNSGKCPTCATDFNNEHFSGLKETLLEKKNSLDNIKLEIESNIKSLREKQAKLDEISTKTTGAYNDITYLIKGYKAQIDKLSTQTQSETVLPNIGEFEDSIKELELKKEISVDGQAVCKEKELYYKELARIFGEDGVKKSIIASIIRPINHFISENIQNMALPFQVELDETFTAQIKQLGNPIEHDSLSTGETKLLNLSILTAYLKLIRTKKTINILFLDEVFSSIDLDNIEKILNLLKSFANEYKINIFVVHHALMNQELFDRIIHIQKNIFTEIVEVDLN